MKLQDIIQQNLVKPLDFLREDAELCREIQGRLKDLGLLSPSGIDGIYGPGTKQAFVQFKNVTHQSNPNDLGCGSAKILLELKGHALQKCGINSDIIPSPRTSS